MTQLSLVVTFWGGWICHKIRVYTWVRFGSRFGPLGDGMVSDPWSSAMSKWTHTDLGDVEKFLIFGIYELSKTS